MSILSTTDVLAKLKAADTDVLKQIYKSSIVGHQCRVYDPAKPYSNEHGDVDLDVVLVRAEGLEGYLAKGFLVERPLRPTPEPKAVVGPVPRPAKGGRSAKGAPPETLEAPLDEEPGPGDRLPGGLATPPAGGE